MINQILSKRLHYLLSIMLCSIMSLNLYAQTNVLNGTVVDSSGEPIIGASIVEKDSRNGTVSDIDGKFNLKFVGNSQEIIVSSIGYKTQNLATIGQKTIKVTMEEESHTLSEMVVVGYGVQKKENLTGSVVSVKMDEISKRQVGQTSLALQGLVPGLTVQQTSGQPGMDGGTMRIRGITTLNNNNPYILVDGVEMPINSIDANMIESISVLKDAAASAIYGNRAANGVILVKTKRGQQEKLSVTYNAYVGWQSATETPDKVNALDHMRLLHKANINAGVSSNFTDDYINQYAENSLKDPDLYPNTDWLDLLLKSSAIMQNHQVSISGGSKKVKTMATVGYFDQDGIINNTNFKRYTMRLSTDYIISDKFTAQADALLTLNKTKQPGREAASAMHWGIRIPATQAAILSDGKWGQGWNGDNPVAYTRDGGLDKREDASAILNLGLTYKPLEWITLQGNYNANYYTTERSQFIRSVTSYNADGTVAYVNPPLSSLKEYRDKGLTNLLTATGTVTRSFDNHNFALLLGYQQEDRRPTSLTAYRENYTFPEYTVLNAGSPEKQLNTGTISELATRSYFSRLNYDFAGKYLFEANIRRDGSSRFAKATRWGTFPSFSMGWRLSEESFMESTKDILSNAKIRASWGKLGNQESLGTFYPYFQSVELTSPYVFDGKQLSGAAVITMANKDLKWETTTMSGVGVDLTFFNKLNITADYYYRKTKDILHPIKIPLITGVQPPVQNIATVENKGWDIDISYADKIDKVGFRLTLNLSDVRNKVLDTNGVNAAGLTAIREGHPINSIFGYKALGYIQPEDYENGVYKYATQFTGYGVGDIRYEDQPTDDPNGKGVINPDDKVVIGNQIPRYTYGISLAVDYNSFDFNMILQGVGKRDGYLYGQGIMPFYNGGTAMEMHKDHWAEDNRNAKFPRPYFGGANNVEHSSFWMKSASYLRLKNIQLGYTLPKQILNKVGIQHARFYLSGENLLTFHSFWKGYDPEAPVGTGTFYPIPKTISMGVQVTF